VRAPFELEPGRWASVSNGGNQGSTKRMEISVYWDVSGALAECSVVIWAESPDAGLDLCKGLAVTFP
jgi:hypothetical protein